MIEIAYILPLTGDLIVAKQFLSEENIDFLLELNAVEHLAEDRNRADFLTILSEAGYTLLDGEWRDAPMLPGFEYTVVEKL
jgi:hypothetical protein